MSTLRTNVIEGLGDPNVVQIPTGVSGKYLSDLVNGGYDIDVKPADLITKGPWVDARAYGTLGTQTAIVAALVDISTTEKTLYLAPGTWNITTNLSILANVNLKVDRGAILTIGTGATVTINGTIEAGFYNIFSCTGTGAVVFSGIRTVKSSWWESSGWITPENNVVADIGSIYINLDDKDHSIYIKDTSDGTSTGWISVNDLAVRQIYSLATAVNDFLIASAAGTFVKKTLNQTQNILLPSYDYYKNLSIKNNDSSPNTKIDIEADLLVVSDSNSNFQLLNSVDLVIDCGTTGANGLDTGSLAIDNFYYFYVIAKSDGTIAGLASLSSTSPTLPSGYTYYKLVGVGLTASASAIFYLFYQINSWVYLREDREYGYPVLLSNSTASPVWYEVDMSSVLPPNVVKKVYINQEVANQSIDFSDDANISYDGVYRFGARTVARNIAGIPTAIPAYSGSSWIVPIKISQTLYANTNSGYAQQTWLLLGYELDI